MILSVFQIFQPFTTPPPHQPQASSCKVCWLLRFPTGLVAFGGVWGEQGIEGEVQPCSPRLLHYHPAVCLLLPALTVRQAEPFPFILHRFTSPWQACFLLLHASKDGFYASLSKLHSASRDRPGKMGTLDREAGQKATEDWHCLVLAFPSREQVASVHTGMINH